MALVTNTAMLIIVAMVNLPADKIVAGQIEINNVKQILRI